MLVVWASGLFFHKWEQIGQNKSLPTEATCSKKLTISTVWHVGTAVIKFKQHYRHNLLGQRFTFRTNHGSLSWLKNFREPEGQLEQLQQFDFEVVNRKGSWSHNSDALSWLPNSQCVDVTAMVKDAQSLSLPRDLKLLHSKDSERHWSNSGTTFLTKGNERNNGGSPYCQSWEQKAITQGAFSRSGISLQYIMERCFK